MQTVTVCTEQAQGRRSLKSHSSNFDIQCVWFVRKEWKTKLLFFLSAVWFVQKEQEKEEERMIKYKKIQTQREHRFATLFPP